MAAPIGAARSTLEMIAGGEDHVAALIVIVVRVSGGLFSRLGKNGPGVVPLARKPGNCLETGPAKTGGFEAIRSEPAQNVIRHLDLLAPAGPFVEFTFGHAAPIVAAAQGTLLILPQAKMGWFRDRRFVVSSLGFHEIDFVQAWGIVILRINHNL